MSRQIALLQPKLELTELIHGTIDKRIQLIAQMKEFEKSASDPARLFRSSFQLLQEEKFRKSAFPSLLNLETKLKTQLADYLRKFRDPFIYYPTHAVCDEEQRPFAEVLDEDISNRYLNETVFGFDQPQRRKTSATGSSNTAATTIGASAPRYTGTSTTSTLPLQQPHLLPQRRSRSRMNSGTK